MGCAPASSAGSGRAACSSTAPTRRPRKRNCAASVTDLAVASYLARYSTKGTEAAGHASARLTPETIRLHGKPDGSHAERLIHAAWQLGRAPGPMLGKNHCWDSLQRWAHMLGFGGHFLTKARRYSVTFTALRQARITYRRTQEAGPVYRPGDCQDDVDTETTIVLNSRRSLCVLVLGCLPLDGRPGVVLVPA